MTEENQVAETLSRLRKSRSANRNVLLGLVTKAQDKMNEGGDEAVKTEVKVILQLIRCKEEAIIKTNEDIMALIPEDKMEEDMEEATNFELKVKTRVFQIEDFLATLGQKEKLDGSSGIERKERDGLAGVKLPKIHIKKFSGEPTEWQQFLDTFSATVHRNTRISKIEKFSYLTGFLGGAAEKCIEGIPLVEDNYQKALDLLGRRFGNKQVIISAHVNKLLKLDKVKTGRNIQELRNLFDQVESHVRSLSSLNVLSEHYGPLLIPIILERLPDDIRLQISRILGQENWMIEEFMATLKVEIVARESCCYMKSQVGAEDKSKGYFTTGALMTGMKPLVCAFCGKDHYHDKCTVVTDIEERKEYAKKNRLCYKCLFKSHTIRNCRSKRNCYSCKGTNHHSAICNKKAEKRISNGDGDGDQAQQVQLVGSRTSVLLQTACAIASDNRETRNIPVKIVLDSGAERTYIAEKLVKKLQLEPKGEQNVILNTFGNSEGKSTVLKYYSFCLKNPKRGCHLYLTGFAVPVI